MKRVHKNVSISVVNCEYLNDEQLHKELEHQKKLISLAMDSNMGFKDIQFLRDAYGSVFEILQELFRRHKSNITINGWLELQPD